MRYYIVKYCLREDCRKTLQLDQTYNNPSDAINASIELEEDPDIYTSWVDEVYRWENPTPYTKKQKPLTISKPLTILQPNNVYISCKGIA